MERETQRILFGGAPAAGGRAPIFLFGPGLDEAPAAATPAEAGSALECACLRPIDLTATHGINVTRAHLEEMARAYDPAFETATMNFDHAWGGPAHGLCTRVWLVGDYLWSRWENLSRQAIEAIRNRTFPRRSAEFWSAHPQTKGWYFSGLALLGARAPAVPGLPEPQLLAQRPIYRVLLVAPAAASAPAQETETMDDPETKTPETEPAEPPAASTSDDAGVVVAGEETASDTTSTPPNAEDEGDDEPDEAGAQAPAAPTDAGAPSAPTAAASPREHELEQRALRAEARVEVREFLDGLGARLPPSVRRLAEPLLVELAAYRPRIQLVAGGAETAIGDAVRELLAALPEFAALGAGAVATRAAAEPDAPPADDRPDEIRRLHERLGIDQDRITELGRRYGLKHVN